MRNITRKVAKNGDVSYLIRVSDGYASDGTQIKKSMTWKPAPGMSEKAIEKELERQRAAFEEKIRVGFSVDGNVRFADYAARYMEVKEMSPKCRDRYIDLLQRINQSIGHIRLSKLQPMHLQQLYKDLRGIKSKRTGEPLSDKTIHHHHALIRSILAQATREQVIPRNIASNEFMDAPKVAHKEPAHLDDVQAQNVVSLLMGEQDIRVKTSVMLLLFSGMRRGELCGLEWSDIDYTNHLIYIKRASQYIRKVGIITKLPKNITSIRSIKLPVEVFDILREYEEWQKEERLKYGDRWLYELDFIYHVKDNEYKTIREKNNRIFTAEYGGFISPDTINSWVERFRNLHDLPPFSPHGLRHSFVTLQIAAGVDLLAVSKRAGHAQTSTTTNMYGHFIASMQEKASSALQGILRPMDEPEGNAVSQVSD
jgi:integrase